MLVTVVWVAIMATAIVWEVVCHFRRGWASIATLASRLWLHPFGRIAYVATWAFFAWHVFARYTIPR